MSAKVAGTSTERTPHVYQLRRISANTHLSRDAAGQTAVVFLLQSATAIGRSYAGVLLEFLPRCIVTQRTTRSTRAAAVLHCRELSYEPRFEGVVEEIRRVLAAEPNAFSSADRVREFVQGMAELFGHSKQLEETSQRGLWGELHVLAQCPNAAGAVEAWTGPARHVVDFARNGIEIEVKSSLGNHVHRVQDRQIAAAISKGSRRFLWSVCLREDPAGGLTLRESVGRVRSALSNRLEFERKLSRWGYSDSVEYPARWAAVSEIVIDQVNLPILPSMPPQVSNVHFDLDVSQLPALTPTQARSQLVALSENGDDTP